jgi:hypothetical protein
LSLPGIERRACGLRSKTEPLLKLGSVHFWFSLFILIWIALSGQRGLEEAAHGPAGLLRESASAVVPNTVPTPHIEALFGNASLPGQESRNALETSNRSEQRAMIVSIANLLILRAFTIRNQQVSGSSPEGGSINPLQAGACRVGFN